MKSKPALMITGTIIIILAVVLMAANHLRDITPEAEALEGEIDEIIVLQREITVLETRLSHLEHHIPNMDLKQSIQGINMELAYMKDLLNSVPGIETLYGRITGYDGAEEFLLEVEVIGDGETVHVPFAENASIYMITEIAWAPINSSEFMEVLEESSGDKGEIFTFKIIEGKAVQIYQGEKSE